jgi:peptidoglycan-associated lipoprotein
MKLVRLVPLLAVGLALSLGGIGCRKNLDKVTNIPGQPPPRPETAGTGSPLGTGNPLDSGTGTGTGVTGAPGTGEGIKASQRNFDNMDQNREVFAADTIHFDFDKSNVRTEDVPKLENIARRMKSEYQGKFLRIEGYCDERGTEEYNRALGDRRALSAREYLARLGINPEDIQTISFGEEKPADPAHNEAAWAKNRRCEFVLLTPK